MDLKRIVRHLTISDMYAHRLFPEKAMKEIAAAVAASEARHTGEVRFAVEGSLDLGPLLKGVSARERAVQVFGELGVWDTEANNGVLIYLLIADHDVEIVADRAIHRKVEAHGWEVICRSMEADFRAGNFVQGVLKGIEAAGRHLEIHFPRTGAEDRNELPDRPVVL